MGTKRVLIQANHGPIVAAEDVPTAWWYLYYLERVAKLTLAAMSTGRKLRTISDEVGLPACYNPVLQATLSTLHKLRTPQKCSPRLGLLACSGLALNARAGQPQQNRHARRCWGAG